MSYSLAFTQAVAITMRVGARNFLERAEFVSSKELSETLCIPRPTIVSIITKLTNAKILITKEGINGGVRLSRKPTEITLYDVFEAIESSKPLFRRDMKVDIDEERLERVITKLGSVLDQAEEAMKNELKKTLIAELFC
ncbi:MAG: RrF2 family transcriptional regulator [Acidobacteriota bacterium]